MSNAIEGTNGSTEQNGSTGGEQTPDAGRVLVHDGITSPCPSWCIEHPDHLAGIDSWHQGRTWRLDRGDVAVTATPTANVDYQTQLVPTHVRITTHWDAVCDGDGSGDSGCASSGACGDVTVGAMTAVEVAVMLLQVFAVTDAAAAGPLNAAILAMAEAI